MSIEVKFQKASCQVKLFHELLKIYQFMVKIFKMKLKIVPIVNGVKTVEHKSTICNIHS